MTEAESTISAIIIFSGFAGAAVLLLGLVVCCIVKILKDGER